jgi:hypothetical protein
MNVFQVSEYGTMIAFNEYLNRLGPRAPVKTMEEFNVRGEFHSSLKAGLANIRKTPAGTPSLSRRGLL